MREANRAEWKQNTQATSQINGANESAPWESSSIGISWKHFDEAAANDLASQMVEKQTERRVAMLKQHEMMSVLTHRQKTQLKKSTRAHD